LAEFLSLLEGGNAGRGRTVFFSSKTACSTCHQVSSEGGRIGPDLTTIGAIRAGRDMIESIVFPSSTIAQEFEPYTVVTTDGRAISGILAGQTADTIVLRDSSGAETRLRRDQIEEMNRQPTSIMPEGLDRLLSPQEFRDLLAYLQSLR
jgi:putative heme-binding domain-containing protein